MIEIKLPLNDLMELLTYNRLFDYVHVPSPVGAYITLADPDKTMCVVEPLSAQLSIVWYPTQSYIEEQKRRHEINYISKAHEDVRKNLASISTLNGKLLQACALGDMEEMERLTNLIQQLTK